MMTVRLTDSSVRNWLIAKVHEIAAAAGPDGLTSVMLCLGRGELEVKHAPANRYGIVRGELRTLTTFALLDGRHMSAGRVAEVADGLLDTMRNDIVSRYNTLP